MRYVGLLLGTLDGTKVGNSVGSPVGEGEGTVDGRDVVGTGEGRCVVGPSVGATVGGQLVPMLFPVLTYQLLTWSERAATSSGISPHSWLLCNQKSLVMLVSCPSSEGISRLIELLSMPAE